MVALHCGNYPWVSAEFLKDAHPDIDMCALYLVVERFTDVVDQGACFGDSHIRTKLLCQHASNVSHLNRVLQNVLAVAGTEIQAPQNSHDSRIEVKNSAFVYRLLSLLFNYLVYFLLSVFH